MTQVRNTALPAFLIAAALHAAALGWIARRPPAPPPPRSRPPTTVRLVARPPRPAPVAAPQAPPAPPAARPSKADPPPRVARAQPPPAAAPTPAAPPAPGPPPAPRRFAVSMGATAPGGVAVPVTTGPTAARGDPGAPASAPAGDNTAFATAPADVTEVDRAPRLLRQPSDLELRGLYPEAARRERLEADVRLELLVTADGAVAEVRVVEPAGHGFDEVAVRAARQIAFRPAERGGRSVAVRIPWTLRFRIDG